MGIMSALFTGISGLNANGTALSVISDNIANISTTGFKGSRVSFANMLSQSLSGAASNSSAGGGVSVSSIASSWSQGSFETTSSPTDLAINGSGFFMVADDSGVFYTRAGQFSFDKEGNVVNPQGLVVQGWLADTDGTIANTIDPGSISISTVSSAPRASSSFALGVNLDADSEASDTYATSFTVYDSLGSTHTLTINYEKTANPGEWEWHITFSDTGGAVVLDPPMGGERFIGFDPSGNLVHEGNAGAAPYDGAGPFDTTNPTIAITGLTNGAADLSIDWDLFLDGSSLGTVTGYALSSNTDSLIQDGYGAGTLQGISISDEGVMTGIFSNGQTRDIAQLALADFASYGGLIKMGGNLYAESNGSGQPNIGTAGSGSKGKLSSGSLEMSNVDMAAEFVKMITIQRSFQANSRVITTSDDMLNELVNLKR